MAEASALLSSGRPVGAFAPAGWVKRHPYLSLVVLAYLFEVEVTRG